MRRVPPRRPVRSGRPIALLALVFVLSVVLIDTARRGGSAEERPHDGFRLPNASDLFRPWLSTRGDEYELDDVERFVDPRGTLPCPSDAIVSYRGSRIRYDRMAFVHRAFAPRLELLEAVIAETATEVYGRAPRRLVHRGAFNCRRARGRPERMSEHALGNALDVQGFDFGPMPRDVEAPADLPRHLRRGFVVRVSRHWSPARERDGLHARFLHALVDRLHERPDVIRGIVGPPARRHHDHLHFDVAPWRYAWYAHD